MPLHSEHDRILSQVEVYKVKQRNQSRQIANLDEKIIQHELKELEQKRRVGSDIPFKEHKIETERHIYIDRLNKKLVALNTKISQNKELRRKIDEMRQERCRYDAIYTKLEYNIQRHADTMKDTLEKGKTTIKLRDKAVGELDALTKQLDESKSSLRLEQEELHKLEEQFQEGEQVKRVERRVSRPPTSASQKTAAEEKQNEEDQEFDDEKALDIDLTKVLASTGIDDVNVLIERLTQTENLHFGLFSRINELEAEASKNETKISDAEQELKRVQRCGINNDTQRQKERLSMEEKRKQLEMNIHDVELDLGAQLNTWNSVRSKIMTVHDELGISVPEDLIGTNSVTENNVMQYLAAIENKTSEILIAIHGDYEDQESNGETPLSMANNASDNGSFVKALLELPSATTGEDSELDDDDDGERPFTMEELQESVYA